MDKNMTKGNQKDILDLDLTDVVAHRVPGRDELVDEVRIVGLGAGGRARAAVDALGRIEEVRQLFLDFLHGHVPSLSLHSIV